MRNIERLLIYANFAGSVLLGLRNEPAWLGLLVTALALYVLLADRALRRQIGPRHWPSEGYARFAFNTNLYFAFCQLLFGTALFAAAGTLSGLLDIRP